MSLRKAKRQLFAKTINRKIAWSMYCIHRQRVAKYDLMKMQINGATGAYIPSITATTDPEIAEEFAETFRKLYNERVRIKKEINKARKSFNPKKALRKYKLPG